MSLNEQTNNNNQEVDVLALLEYFKKGIINLIKGIKSFFNSILNLIIYLLLLIKKNVIWIILITSLIGILGYLKHTFLPSYRYEIIVEPNFGTTHDLYSFVESNKIIKTNKHSISSISIKPVESLSDAIEMYYNVGQLAKGEKDTIFYNEYKIEDFIENLEPFDYKKQKISISTKTPENTGNLQKYLIKKLEENIDIQETKLAQLNSLEEEKRRYNIALNRIDSLLKTSQKAKEVPITTIQFSGEGKSNVEKDLSEEYKTYTALLNQIEIQKDVLRKTIRVVSPMKQVPEKDIVGKNYNPIKYLIYGFIISLLFLLGLNLLKFLNKLENSTK